MSLSVFNRDVKVSQKQSLGNRKLKQKKAIGNSELIYQVERLGDGTEVQQAKSLRYKCKSGA